MRGKDGGGGNSRYSSRGPPPSNSHYGDYPGSRDMYPRPMYNMGRMGGGTFLCKIVYDGTWTYMRHDLVTRLKFVIISVVPIRYNLLFRTC